MVDISFWWLNKPSVCLCYAAWTSRRAVVWYCNTSSCIEKFESGGCGFEKGTSLANLGRCVALPCRPRLTRPGRIWAGRWLPKTTLLASQLWVLLVMFDVSWLGGWMKSRMILVLCTQTGDGVLWSLRCYSTTLKPIPRASMLEIWVRPYRSFLTSQTSWAGIWFRMLLVADVII